MTRIAYFNGKFVPETEVLIPYRDRSFNRGDGCFDMTRTFDGRIFRLAEHVERLYRSLRYLRIDIGLEPKEIVAISEEVVLRNEHLRAAAGDWWLAQRVSRGVDAIGDEGWAHTGPQVIVDCTPLPLKARAPQFRDGIDVVVPSIRRIPPPMLSPRAKTHNYLNLILADKEVKAAQPQAWSVLLDENGNLCEGIGSNIFVVRDERIYTPREKYVLPGVSRRTAMELAGAARPDRGGARPRRLRRRHRRRGLPDLDQPLHLPRPLRERPGDRRRPRARSGDQAHHAGVHRSRGHRFRGPVPVPAHLMSALRWLRRVSEALCSG